MVLNGIEWYFPAQNKDHCQVVNKEMIFWGFHKVQ